MRIGIQLLSLKPGHIGGQEVYLQRLIRTMLAMLGDDRLILFLRPIAAAQADFQEFTAHSHVEAVIEDPEPRYGPRYAEWNLRLLAAAALDVVYFPLSFFFPRPLPLPVAVHVPDLQHEFFPEYFPPEQLAWRRERIPESVAMADATITHTRFSALSLIEKLGADEHKLHVISAGGFLPDELKDGTTVAGFGPDDPPFVFYPAADWPHKNHETLLQALALLPPGEPPLRLALSGMLSQRGELLRRLARELKIAERVAFLGCVSRPELIGLYRAARLMAFPSRFEGFGLPLIEAMQLGCPVVASKAEGVQETAGQAALLCDDEPAAWTEALGRVAQDASLAADLRRRGFERAQDFNWDDAAARHLTLLRTLAQ